MDDSWLLGWPREARASVLRLDAEGRILGLNPAAREALGLGEELPTGERRWFDWLPAQLAPRVREELAGWLEGSAGPLATFQCPLRGASGELRGFAWTLCALPERGGALLTGAPIPPEQEQALWRGPVATHAVLNQRAVEEETRRSARLFDSVMENMPMMLFLKDARDLRFLRFNKAGEELLGWPRSELLGRSDEDFFSREQAAFFMSKDRAVLAGGAAVDIPEEPIDTARGLRWLHTRKLPLKGDDGAPQFLLGISEDITEKRQTLQALQAMTRELTESNRDLEQFAYVASHDLQEPLRMVGSFAQLLARRYKGRLDADADEFIDHITGGAKRMHGLINGLLSWSRVGSQKQAFAPTDCEAVLRAVLLDLHFAIEDSGATVEVGPLPTLRGDADQLGQLFTNLLNNALKFRGKAAPVVRLSATEVEGDWLFSVRDNGIGIPREQHGRIFGIFQRLHSVAEYPGSGIGLAVCKRIVERHRGQLWVESPPEGGTAFRFTLPRM